MLPRIPSTLINDQKIEARATCAARRTCPLGCETGHRSWWDRRENASGLRRRSNRALSHLSLSGNLRLALATSCNQCISMSWYMRWTNGSKAAFANSAQCSASCRYSSAREFEIMSCPRIECHAIDACLCFARRYVCRHLQVSFRVEVQRGGPATQTPGGMRIAEIECRSM